MIGRDFKTVVFFGSGDAHYEYIKGVYASYDAIKVFVTPHVDELDQILKQSNKTAVLINDVLSIDKLKALDAGAIKRASIRFYFLDHDKRLTRDEIDKLSYKKVSTLISESGPELRKRLDLYLMGRSTFFHVQTASSNSVGSETETVSTYKPMFFTHFRFEENHWKMVASTHEQELDIETVLSRSWTVYYSELMKRADSIQEIEQDADFSTTYHSIIYPHPKMRAISLIHICKLDKNFQELVGKAFDFLQKV